MRDYREAAKHAVVNNWPAVRRTENSKWRRDWQISFRDEIPSGLCMDTLSLHFSGPDFFVVLKQVGTKKVVATVMTERDGRSDEFVVASLTMLQAIDEKMGPIDTIEGEARDLWWPWRWSKLYPNYQPNSG